MYMTDDSTKPLRLQCPQYLADIPVTETGISFEGGSPLPEQVKICEAWISKFCTPQRSINHRLTSYRLKHRVETWAGDYVSNGAMIQAFVNSGYYYTTGEGSNAFFNVSVDGNK